MPKPKHKKRIFKNFSYNHIEVVEKLRAMGWTVMISPYYSDIHTQKSREIDIIAEKKVPVDYDKYIALKLFIECKYVNDDIGFWFDNIDNDRAKKYFEGNIYENSNNTFFETHRYLSSPTVAKLFYDKDNKKLFDAVTQSIHSLMYFRKNYIQLTKDDSKSHMINIKTINFPIVLLNSFSNVYQITVKKEEKIEDNFLFEINYGYTGRKDYDNTEYFLVDIVNYHQLEEFISELENQIISAKDVYC